MVNSRQFAFQARALGQFSGTPGQRDSSSASRMLRTIPRPPTHTSGTPLFQSSSTAANINRQLEVVVVPKVGKTTAYMMGQICRSFSEDTEVAGE